MVRGYLMIQIRPITQKQSKAAVGAWHSHHKPHRGEKYSIGGFVGEVLVAVVVVGRPVSATLQVEPCTLEVTRLAVGPDAPHCAASRLLGAAWRSASGMGCDRLISYTRVDEAGTCYRAAGWVPVALTKAEDWDHGNKSLRWLPGLYSPTTEVIQRGRWEIGPRAATSRVRRNAEGVWEVVPQIRPEVAEVVAAIGEARPSLKGIVW